MVFHPPMTWIKLTDANPIEQYIDLPIINYHTLSKLYEVKTRSQLQNDTDPNPLSLKSTIILKFSSAPRILVRKQRGTKKRKLPQTLHPSRHPNHSPLVKFIRRQTLDPRVVLRLWKRVQKTHSQRGNPAPGQNQHFPFELTGPEG